VAQSAGQSEALRALVDWSVYHPSRVLVPWCLALLLAIYSVMDLRIDTTMGSALNRTDHAWRVYERSLEMHGGDEFVVVALPPAETPFSVASLSAIIDLTDKFEQLAVIRRVDSLASVALIRTEPDGAINVGPGLSRDTLESPRAIEELVAQLRRDRIAPGSIVSSDERVLALNLVFDRDVDGDREAAVKIVRSVLLDYPGAVISGVPVVRADAGIRTRNEIMIFIPATVLLIGLVVFSVFGRIQAILVPLVVGGVSTVACMGIMAALGVTLSFSTAILPSVILALACAYTMHFLSAARGCEGRSDLSRALNSVARPVVLSGVTTALGFLAMSISRIGLIRDLATYGALGALLVSLASVTLAPAFLGMFPLPPMTRFDISRRISEVWAPILVGVIIRNRRAVVGCWVVSLLLVGIGGFRLHVSSDVILWFPQDGQLRTSYETIRSRLSGITPLNVLIESENDLPVTTPEALKVIDSLAAAIQQKENVGKVLSVADPLRLLHREIANPLEGALPEDQRLIDQYLLLLDGVDQMSDVLTSDHKSANILVRADNNSSAEIASLARSIETWWLANGIPGYSASPTGIMYEFGRAQDEIAYGGIVGLVLAVIAIGCVLILFFRDVSIAAIALVANGVPIGILFGLVGWLGVPLDAATVCVASLSIGIAVDDTIHVVSGFQESQNSGESREASLDRCLRTVLPALLFTTVTISIGFGVLGISDFSLVRNLGLMMAGAAVLCLLSDVILLPALLASRPRLYGR
jgi:predicted RND superfamily exporter protein